MRILQVVHGFPPSASAGTEVYVRNLSRALADVDDVRVFTRDADTHRAELSVVERRDGVVGITAVNNTFQACASFEESYTHPGIEAIAGAFLDSWRPDVVHVQHLTCLSTGIPRQAARRGIPVVMTLNDYWLICHRGQLVDRKGARCGGPFDGGCDGCIEAAALAHASAVRAGRVIRAFPLPGAASAVNRATRVLSAVTPATGTRAASLARLRHMQDAVRDVAIFLAPSGTLEAQFLEFGIPRERLVRCRQGVVLPPVCPALPAVRPGSDSGSPLRLGFAGGFHPTKGLEVLLDAIDRLPEGAVTLDVFGASAAYHGDGDHLSALLARAGGTAIRRLGPVPHERMPSLLADLDVLVVPSVWIENAPFIIHEAFASGVPVIASDLGGMAEMVQNDVNGLLFAAGSAEALATQIRRVIDDGGLLRRLRAGIVRPLSIEEDAAQLRDLYRSLSRSVASSVASGFSRTPSVASGFLRTSAPTITAIILNYRTPEQTCIAARSIQTSLTPVHDIHIIDNGSGDDSAIRVQQALRDVRVTALPANGGFSAGCNVGIRAALAEGADRVLLVNSDAVLAPDALGHLAAALDRDEEIGIAAPVLLSREEPDHIASAGIAFSARTGRMRHRCAGRRMAALPPGPVASVDAVSGCVMLIRREVFERAGLLDEAYFFSFEDIEFCLRARAAGFRTVCVQDARAYHEGGRSIGRRSARRVYFATRNHLRLAAQAGSAAGRPLRAGLVVGLNAAYVLVSPEAPLGGGFAALVRGAWHHFSGRYGSD